MENGNETPVGTFEVSVNGHVKLKTEDYSAGVKLYEKLSVDAKKSDSSCQLKNVTPLPGGLITNDTIFFVGLPSVADL